ncbi:MAG TPA: cupin domain-containing protein [Burkholderiales bacterium]|nr:cupin domain-containing protein [Burkholderiales bacterium]
MDHATKFSVSHLNEADFKTDGLRPFFQYRDLGIKDATNGRVLAHVIRAIPGKHVEPQRHHHVCDFQFVYVLKGWIEFDYEGVGKVRLTAGTCVHQRPEIKHTELGHSDDLELIEMVMPADFETVDD